MDRPNLQHLAQAKRQMAEFRTRAQVYDLMSRTTNNAESQEAGRQRLEEMDREEAARRHQDSMDQTTAHFRSDRRFKAVSLIFGASTLTVTLLLFFGIAPPKHSHLEPAAQERAIRATKDASSPPDTATDASKSKALPQEILDTPPSKESTEKQ